MESKVRKLWFHPRFHTGSQRVNKQHHSKVLLNSFPMNGHSLGFCPLNQKLENFVSPKIQTPTFPALALRQSECYVNAMDSL